MCGTWAARHDWLHTDRVHTDLNGAIAATYTSLPFGDGDVDNVSEGYAGWNFTRFGDMDNNLATNMRPAWFRTYSSLQGRWTTPDPYDGSYDFTNPQSFNRYSYVLNNPLSFIDPSGLDSSTCFEYYDVSLGREVSVCDVIADPGGGPGCTPLINPQGQFLGCVGQTPQHTGTPNGSTQGQNSGNAGAPSNNRHYSMADVCAASTLLNRGGPAVLDALGIIPVEGNLLSAGQLLASGASLGISLASSPQKITGGQLLGVASVPLGVTGTLLGVLKSAGSAQFAREIAPLAKLIPAVWNFVSAVSLFNDIVGTDGVADYYHACLAGKN